MLDNDVDANEQAETIPGLDHEIPGVDDTEGEIPGVDDAKGTPGMDDTTPGVGDEATPGVGIPGVDDDVPDTANESDKAKIDPTSVERTSSAMNLSRQPRKEYNRKNYDNVFNITYETQKDGIILMQLKYK